MGNCSSKDNTKAPTTAATTTKAPETKAPAAASTGSAPAKTPASVAAKDPFDDISTEEVEVEENDEDKQAANARAQAYKIKNGEVVVKKEGASEAQAGGVDTEGAQAGAGKPFINQQLVEAPEGYEGGPVDGVNNTAPAQTLRVKNVIGYRSRDVVNNAFVLQDGSIVYPAAALVVHQAADGTQKILTGHTDDVLSVDVVTAGGVTLIASGEIGVLSRILVRNASTGEQVFKKDSAKLRGASLVRISPDGTKLAAAHLDNNNTVIVYDVASGATVASLELGANAANDLAWDRNADAPNASFVTVGNKEIYAFTLNGKTLEKKRISVPKPGVLQNFTSVSSTADHLLVATQGGKNAPASLYAFSKGKLVKCPHQEEGKAFNAVKASPEGLFAFGGSSGIVYWRKGVGKDVETQSLSLSQFAHTKAANGIRSVDILGNTILVGTSTSQIISIDATSKAAKQLVDAHYSVDIKDPERSPELWGLVVSPSNNEVFATFGGDHLVRVWNSSSRKLLASQLIVPEKATDVSHVRSIDWSVDGTIAVGDISGHVSFLKFDGAANTLSEPQTVPVGKRRAVVRFSPDGKTLAVGSHSGSAFMLYFVDVESKSIKKQTEPEHQISVVEHLDWSKDGKHVRVTTLDREILYFDGNTRARVNLPISSGLELATYTSKLGFDVQGIWSYEGATAVGDISQVNAVARNNGKNLLAVARDERVVVLYRYPCIGGVLASTGAYSDAKDVAQGHSYKAFHSEHVTNVAFTLNDTQLISTGGSDTTIIVWDVQA